MVLLMELTGSGLCVFISFVFWDVFHSSLKAASQWRHELVVLTPAVFPPASYWDNFHSCATTALADCQEGATDLWEKLKKESRTLDFRGSLFELCGGGNAAPPSSDARGLAWLLTALPTLLTWLAF
ncbi:unnamed protein product [Pleuronectes platessa]|uniref:Neuritin n=1 Tax=Pleuronectes platessa TaxID=8262 RepID=A0A9N7YVV4_PLEPL|nr:unnamed protein product [Pleuronectes platessa]